MPSKTKKNSPKKPIASKSKAQTHSKKQAKPVGKKPLKKTKKPIVATKSGKGKQTPSKKPPADVRFSLADSVQRLKEVAWRLIEGEAVIITPADSTMHSLNDTGTRIWELINGDRTLREVASVISSEFDVEADRAQKDTIWFAECLAKKGLVESV
jgi:hypothetical protein